MVLFLVLLLFVPFLMSAQTSSSVVISEIAWMGSSVDEVDTNQHWRYEWLELRSTVERSMVLDGWNIELYRPSSAKVFDPEASDRRATEDKGELYFTIPLSDTIPAQGYFLVGASDRIANLDINYANLGGKLVNTGMKIVLSRCARSPEGRKDNICEIIDEVDANNGWPAGDNETKRTMERIAGSDPAMWQTSAVSGGTPKVKNSEGFQEVAAQPFSFATKKDLKGSSQDSFNVLSGTILLAVLLALGSSVGILGLRRYLARPEQS